MAYLHIGLKLGTGSQINAWPLAPSPFGPHHGATTQPTPWGGGLTPATGGPRTRTDNTQRAGYLGQLAGVSLRSATGRGKLAFLGACCELTTMSADRSPAS